MKRRELRAATQDLIDYLDDIFNTYAVEDDFNDCRDGVMWAFGNIEGSLEMIRDGL